MWAFKATPCRLTFVTKYKQAHCAKSVILTLLRRVSNWDVHLNGHQ